MNSFESFFASELAKLIRVERQERLEGLAAKVGFEEYLSRVGYVQALDWVIEACGQVEKKLKSPG